MTGAGQAQPGAPNAQAMGAPNPAQTGSAGGQANGAQPDYSAQWAEYYRSMGKIKEAEAIEAQIKAKVIVCKKCNLKMRSIKLLILSKGIRRWSSSGYAVGQSRSSAPARPVNGGCTSATTSIQSVWKLFGKPKLKIYIIMIRAT